MQTKQPVGAKLLDRAKSELTHEQWYRLTQHAHDGSVFSNNGGGKEFSRLAFIGDAYWAAVLASRTLRSLTAGNASDKGLLDRATKTRDGAFQDKVAEFLGLDKVVQECFEVSCGICKKYEHPRQPNSGEVLEALIGALVLSDEQTALEWLADLFTSLERAGEIDKYVKGGKGGKKVCRQ